jgi:CBS domain containing-hemolysin-like protein
MESTLAFELIVAIVALTIHAMAGVAELGGDIFNRRRAQELQEEIRSGKRTTLSLVEGARAYRASMIVVRIATAIIAAVLIEDIIERVFYQYHLALNFVILLVALSLAGIGLPRAVLQHGSDRQVELCVRFSARLAKLCRPLVVIGDVLAVPMRFVLPGREGMLSATEEEVRDATSKSRDDQALQAAEQRMIDGVLELEDLRASDIMVPRVDMIAVSVDTPVHQILQIITTTGHSRIPIYEQTIDEILGVLHAKDLLPFVTRNVREVQIRRLLRDAYIVPESKRVDALLRDMRRQRQQVAVIADEYGGIAGIISIEDIVEEIIGEIHDEHDRTVEDQIIRFSDGSMEASGGVPMHEIVDHFGLELGDVDDDDYDTIGGFVLKHLQRLPIEGDVVESGGIHVEVLRVERHRVRRVRIDRVVLADEEPTGEIVERTPVEE